MRIPSIFYQIHAKSQKSTKLSLFAERSDKLNFQKLYAQDPEIFCVIRGPKHIFEFVNDAHVRMLGFNATGMSARKVYLYSVEILDILDKVYSTGKSVFFYKSLLTTPGRRRYYNLTYIAERNELNRITGVLVFGIEVTCRIDQRYSLNLFYKRFSHNFRESDTLVNHIPFSFLGFIDPRTGCISHLNEQSAKIIRKTRNELIGRILWECPWWQSIPKSASFIKEIVEKAIRGVSSRCTLQYWSSLVSPNGHLSWGSFQAVPITSDYGNVEWVALLGIDITDSKKNKIRLNKVILEHKQIQEPLRKSDEELQIVLDTMPQLVWTADSNGNVTYLNKRWSDYCGAAFTCNLKQYGIAGGIHEQDVPHLLNQWEYAKQSGEAFSIEYRIQGKDGIYRWFSGSVIPLRNSLGKIVQWVGSLTNIDEAKRSRLTQDFLDKASSVIASSLEFKVALQSLAELVVLDRADLCVIDMLNQDGNFELAALAHKDPAVVAFAKECWSVYSIEMGLNLGSVDVLKTGKPVFNSEVSEQLLIQKAQNKLNLDLIHKLKIYSLIIVPLQNNGRIFGTIKFIILNCKQKYNFNDLLIFKELAKRSAVAIENLKIFDELKEAVKFRNTFLSIASHELKTPLTSLKLQAQTRSRALQRGDLSRFTPEQLPKMVEEDHLQVNRLIRLVDNMLNIFCNQTGKLTLYIEEFDLCDLIRESVSKFQVQRGVNKTQFNLSLKNVVKGSWDRFRLEQVFINLLTNALNFGRNKPIDIEVGATPENAIFSVKDYGIGIEKKDQSRIFDQFERAVSAETNPGLGLGLFISKKIIELHHGEIRVKSEPKMGSTFTVILPRMIPKVMCKNGLRN